MKASHYYKATSLEEELQKQVSKNAGLKAKINKIGAVLQTLAHMVNSGKSERSEEDEHSEKA